MVFKKKMFTPGKWFLLAIGLILYFGVTGKLTIEGWYYCAMGTLAVACCIILFVLLDMRASRVAKGLFIIGFGATIPIWAAFTFEYAFLHNEVARNSLVMLTQLFNLASAGAGGSIIAVHGEKSATDNDIASAPFNITSDTRRIIELEHQSSRLVSWIKILCVLVAIMVLGLFLNLLR